MDAREQAARNHIFSCVTGSRAYGTSTATSDLDVRGVFAADPISRITPFFPVDQVEGPGDTVMFELSKYVRMVTDQNPNVVELLWVDPSDILRTTPAWEMLREARGQLLTRKVRHTYGGFATQALKQIKGRDRWINKPQPEEPPVPRDFLRMVHNVSLGRDANAAMPLDGRWTLVGAGRDLFLAYEGGTGSWHDAHGNLRTFTREEASGRLGNPPAAIVWFDRENYDARKRDHENYWTWKRERNPDRAALEAAQGMDGKNAAHLIRLLRTAREILREGVVRVRRPDAAELLSIRRGEVGYERVLEMAAEIEAGLAADEAASPLPRAVDQKLVGDLVMGMYEATWKRSALYAAASVWSPGDGTPPDPRGRVVAIDLEMTGFADPGRNQVVEFAAVEIVGGRVTGRTLHSYVDPRAKVNPFARRVHGLSRSFLEGKPTFAEAAPRLLEFIGSSPVVAHNAESDLRALNNDLALAGMPLLPRARAACTQRLATRLFGGAPMGLDALCDVFSMDRGPRERGHGALVDATLLADCLLRMSEMPLYAKASGVWVDKDLSPRKPRDEGAERCVGVSLVPGGARFELADGRVLETDLPDFPADTHALRLTGSNSVVVSPVLAGPDARPDNPLGPALLDVREGAVRRVVFAGGRPVWASRDAEEPAAVPEDVPAPAPGR